MRCIAASIHPFWGGVPVILWSARQLFLTRLSYTGQPRRGQADGETVSYDGLMLAPQFQCSHPFAVIAVAKSPYDTQGSFKACAAVFSQGQLCQQLLNVGVGVLQQYGIHNLCRNSGISNSCWFLAISAKLQLNQLLMIFFSLLTFFSFNVSVYAISVSAMCYCVFVSMHTSTLLCSRVCYVRRMILLSMSTPGNKGRKRLGSRS